MAQIECVELTARLETEHGGRQLGMVTSVVEFPTIKAARAFWNHPDYERVVGIRRAGSDCHVVLIDAATVVGPVASNE